MAQAPKPPEARKLDWIVPPPEPKEVLFGLTLGADAKLSPEVSDAIERVLKAFHLGEKQEAAPQGTCNLCNKLGLNGGTCTPLWSGGCALFWTCRIVQP